MIHLPELKKLNEFHLNKFGANLSLENDGRMLTMKKGEYDSALFYGEESSVVAFICGMLKGFQLASLQNIKTKLSQYALKTLGINEAIKNIVIAGFLIGYNGVKIYSQRCDGAVWFVVEDKIGNTEHTKEWERAAITFNEYVEKQY